MADKEFSRQTLKESSSERIQDIEEQKKWIVK
jgi:hypothetical protein